LTLESGRRLGAYEIKAPLGTGGMGEVYRATDTRLGRDVALKLLPAAFATHPERLARFEREAKVLASLNHPGIAHLYGFEAARLDDGSEASLLVMELAEGEDLAERLKRGPLPLDEAVSAATQVAEALEEAHEKGVVHRDLKPGNVKLLPDGRIKVLDFGLAKAWSGDGAPAASSSELSQSPTLTSAGSAAGLILGTAAYMSPEQARGKPVDKRADVWAFGALLFEMLTGRKLFEGETVSDVLAAVLTREPSWSELPSATPPRVRRLLERCLERDPRLRLRDIGEARIALASGGGPADGAGAGATGAPAARLARALPWALAALLGAALAAERLGARGAAPFPKVAFSFLTADTFFPTAKVSPDGRVVAFNQGSLLSRTTIMLRALDGLDATPLPPGNLGSLDFFWSPDGRELALATPRALVAADVGSGTLRTIAELVGGEGREVRGGDWGRDGTILLSNRGTIYRVDAAGGTLVPVVEPQPDRFSWHGHPLLLPDGRRFAFTSEMRESGENIPVIQVASLPDAKDARVVLKRAMLAGATRDTLVWGSTTGELEATPVDPASFEPRGTPRVLAPEVSSDTRAGFVAASISTTGVLAWRSSQDSLSEFVWLDRGGRRLGRVGEPGPWHNFDLSLDGTRVIAATRRQRASAGLFLLDGVRGVTALALDSPDSASDPTFSPDATRIAYRVRNTLVVRPAQGGSETVVVGETAYPDSWSRDGRFLAYGSSRLGHYDLYAIELDAKDKAPVLLAKGSPGADEPRFSPDGRWVAYHATGASGVDQVSVVPFPPTGERWQISGEGGVQPRWSPQGDELFYLDPRGRLMSVKIPGSDPRRAGVPQPLFETALQVSNSFDQLAVASRDRFLLRLPFGEDPRVPVQVVVGWDR
jgi:Tol biopolymer transport system component